METKKINLSKNAEIKQYSASESVSVRNSQSQRIVEELSYNAAKSTQARNESPVKEGYSAQQMVQTATAKPVFQGSQNEPSEKS